MSVPAEGNRQALVVMDCQCAIIDNYVADGAAFLGRARRTIDGARAAGVQVIYIVVGFRPGHPEIAPHNRMFAPVRDGGMFVRDAAAFAVSPEIAPQGNDIVIEKHRVGAFESTALELVLRAQGIDRLALFGVMTSGCVLSTVRRAADLDYAVTVIGDLCADADPQVHDVLLNKVFPSQADVTAADDWVASLTN